MAPFRSAQRPNHRYIAPNFSSGGDGSPLRENVGSVKVERVETMMGVLYASVVLSAVELPEPEWWQRLPVVPSVVVVTILFVLRGLYTWWNSRA